MRNWKRYVVVILIAVSFGWPTNGLTAAANPVKSGDPRLDVAITAVYPALVQIYVLTSQPVEGRERKYQASGSGAIISLEGHVVTNHHVAGKALAIRCVLSTREELEAKLVGTDPLTDISIVKLDLSSRAKNAPPLSVAKFGQSSQLRVGEPILAMGCPLAISQSVTKGIISNLDMIFPKSMTGGLTLDGEDVGSIVKWIGHDAPIFPGNSGGPLVNLKGEIVGINEIGYGLAGAIPADLASVIARDLMEHGAVRRAWIGANFQPLLKTTGTSVLARGVLVSGVIPGSPAEKAGLKAGDLVAAVDGAPVTVRFREELPSFIRSVVSKPVGEPIEFAVQREGKENRLKITSELRDEAQGKEVEFSEWGMTARRLTKIEAKEMQRPDTRGVLIGSVRQGGPVNLAQPSLRMQDVITEVAGKTVADLDAFRKVTDELTRGKNEPEPVLVAFERENTRQLAVVEVGIRPPQDPPAEARKAWLPVATQVLSKKLASALGIKGKMGVRITQVYPESTAEKAGFQIGDIITHVDDQLVEASESHDTEVFESMLWAYKVGSRPEFSVIRDRKPMKISAELIDAPKEEQELRVHEDVAFEFKARDISYLDRVKNKWDKEQMGALVTQVDSGGWAAIGGLRTDDLIQSVDGTLVNDVKDLETILKGVRDRKPHQVIFFVKRGISTLFIEIEPAWRDKS